MKTRLNCHNKMKALGSMINFGEPFSCDIARLPSEKLCRSKQKPDKMTKRGDVERDKMSMETRCSNWLLAFSRLHVCESSKKIWEASRICFLKSFYWLKLVDFCVHWVRCTDHVMSEASESYYMNKLLQNQPQTWNWKLFKLKTNLEFQTFNKNYFQPKKGKFMTKRRE